MTYQFFKDSFFPLTFQNWETLNICKSKLIKFIRPLAKIIFGCHSPAKGLNLLTRLRLGLCHLREHKFKHSFQDTLENPLCSCGKKVEFISHFLLHVPITLTKDRPSWTKLELTTILPFQKTPILKLLSSFYTEIKISLLRLIS